MDALQPVLESEATRLVIAIDYGTTYTGVSITTTARRVADLNEIESILDWGARMANERKVPSVISYSLKSRLQEEQWGTDLSPGSTAMVHTKLQLDVDDIDKELDLILQELEGMESLDIRYITRSEGKLKYPTFSPEQIVEDYLKKVFVHLMRIVDSFTEALRNVLLVDIIATIPVGWGYNAKNSLFRALNGAGFNKKTFPRLRDVLLVPEPEAAAIYTVRHLRQVEYLDLDDGECFTLCDAGGGTVDLVSYQVTQLDPTFQIEKLGLSDGDKCGSIFINMAFKNWLRDVLGEANYYLLDERPPNSKIRPHDNEGQRMRILMRSFEVKKKLFAKDGRDSYLTLPEPLNDLTLDSGEIVHEGQVTISYVEMQRFFEACADQIVKMIVAQSECIQRQRTQHRYVFLVGGFAASEYLQQTIRESLELRDLELRVPTTSWTAVVQGAAILGIEKDSHPGLCKMKAMPRSYGFSATTDFSVIFSSQEDRRTEALTGQDTAVQQMIWMIRKGDVILSDQEKRATRDFTLNIPESGFGPRSIQIYAYDRDRLPDRLSNSERDLARFHDLRYDLSRLPRGRFQHVDSDGVKPAYYVASMSISLKINPGNVEIVLKLGNEILYTQNIRDAKLIDQPLES